MTVAKEGPNICVLGRLYIQALDPKPKSMQVDLFRVTNVRRDAILLMKGPK